MKRILILLFILMSTYINAQVLGADMLNREPKTTVQMNAITVAQGLKNGSEVLNSDTNTIWRYNGTIWEDTGSGGGLQSTDIDTFSELNTIVADATLAKSGDNVSIFTNDAYVALTGNQTNIDGTKAFYDHLFINSNGDSDGTQFSSLFQAIASGDVTSNSAPTGYGGTYFNNDGSFRLQKAGSGANFGIDFSSITATQDLIVTDTDITWNGTSLLSGTGISNLVEDTTPQWGGNMDPNGNFFAGTLAPSVDATYDVGNTVSQFLTAHFERYATPNAAVTNWWVMDSGASDHFGFSYLATPTTAFSPLYTLNNTGTPSAATDLIDKAYADANYGGGGSSPPFDDTTSLVQDPVDGTKEVRIDAGNVPTGTTVTLTAPSSDLNLANVLVGPASATDNNIATFNGTTGKLIKDSGVTLSSGSIAGIASITGTGTNFNISMPPTDTEPGGNEGRIYADNSENRPKYHDGTSWKSFLLTGDTTDDQTASEVNITDAAGYYTGTDVEAMGQEIGADLADRPTSLGTGRTNAVQYSDVFGQTLADYNTDGAGGAGDLIIITDASPAEVVTTATIAMDGWKMYDDQTADAATITLSDCDPGETLTVYINRASAPTLAGTGLTFNQIPNTTAFASATQMMIIFEVAYDGTTIDYYYVER